MASLHSHSRNSAAALVVVAVVAVAVVELVAVVVVEIGIVVVVEDEEGFEIVAFGIATQRN